MHPYIFLVLNHFEWFVFPGTALKNSSSEVTFPKPVRTSSTNSTHSNEAGSCPAEVGSCSAAMNDDVQMTIIKNGEFASCSGGVGDVSCSSSVSTTNERYLFNIYQSHRFRIRLVLFACDIIATLCTRACKTHYICLNVI